MDYKWDWSRWLPASDSIESHEIIEVDDGLTVSAGVHDDKSVTVWVEGGEAGRTYELLCRIETVEGRIELDDATIKVAER